MHRHCEPHEGRWAAGRHHRRGRHGGFGFGGRHGGGMNPDDMRAGRMLAQGDLRLIALALIAAGAAPRLRDHQAGRGEDLGLVLAEPGHRLSDADLSGGSRLRHRFDRRRQEALRHHAEGRVYLEANRDVVDAVLDRLSALGERINRWRRSERGERGNRRTLPPLVEAAFDHLRETVGKRLEGDADDESRLVEILARAAAELQRR